jgi:hypothetical protein
MLTLSCTRAGARPAAAARPSAPSSSRRVALAAPAAARRATVAAAVVAALPSEAELMAPAPVPKSGEKVSV